MSMIVTFYSFKGGVGRTMALANIGILLARRGQNVLAVDWDLEAPSLHRYFGRRLTIQKDQGLLQLLNDAAEHSSGRADWRAHVARVELTEPGRLDVLPAGSDDERYTARLQQFDWNAFFHDHNGGAFIEHLRSDWHSAYDFTLIDSRTGYTDAGGVCTIQLPDVLVAVFTANETSLGGVEEAIAKAQAARQQLPLDRSPLLVLPLPSRFDGRVEVEEAERWTQQFTRRLAPYYADWLPAGTSYRQVVERTRVPHVPFFSFGEKLPVLEQSLTDPEGMAYAYDGIARVLYTDFESADLHLLGERTDPAIKRASDELATLADELEPRLARRVRSLLIIWAGALSVPAAVIALLAISSASSKPFATTASYAVTIVVAVGTLILSAFSSTAVRRTIRRARERQHELFVARRLYRESPGRLRDAYEAALDEVSRADKRSAPSPDEVGYDQPKTPIR